MAEAKTKPTAVKVEDYIETFPDESVRDDCRQLIKIMKRVTGDKPTMWGSSIIGFGQYHYKYESGHEGDACLTGFAVRSGKFALYVMPGNDNFPDLMKKLGKFRASKGCVYIRRLRDIDEKVLEEVVSKSVAWIKKNVATK